MRSKVLIVCVIICHSVLSLSAQNKNDRFHIFGSESKLQLNGYIGPSLAFSTMEGFLSVDAGATAGFIVNRKFFIGLYGQKLVSNVPRADLETIGFPTYTSGNVHMSHAGGVLGWIHNTNKAQQWGFSGSAGIGKLELDARSPTNIYEDLLYDDLIIILVPKLFLEMNMTGRLKINMSAGYRVLGKVNTKYTNQAGESIPVFQGSDYMKPEFSVSLMLGKFDFRNATIF
jgi:hypothetical protein